MASEPPRRPTPRETVPADHNRESAPSPELAPTVRIEVTPTSLADLDSLVHREDRYREVEELGEGGMARVRACLDPDLGRQVAVKTLHPEYAYRPASRSRFVREARIMAQLEHPNIVPVHEVGIAANRALYFTMKRVQGLSLAHILAARKAGEAAFLEAYPLQRLLTICIDICQAVSFAHSRGVLHRDLKPSNILVGSYGEVLVMDWGLARMMNTDDDGPDDDEDRIRPWLEGMDAVRSREGAVSGSPYYMSPEQARGDTGDIDQRTDIYSLGALLYEMLTLQRVPTGKGVAEVLQCVAEGRVIPPRQRAPAEPISPELNAICMKALARAPGDRYPDVESMRLDLESYLAGRPVSVYADPLLRRFWKACIRHPVISASVLAALVATGASVASLAYARLVRQRTFLTLAEDHDREGDRLYAQLVGEAGRLAAAQTPEGPSMPPAEVQRLAESVEALEDQSDNEYELAVILYASANQMRRRPLPAAEAAIRDTFRRRLEYACAIGDVRAAEKYLDLIRRALRSGGANAPEPALRLVDKYERLVEQTRQGQRPPLPSPPPLP